MILRYISRLDSWFLAKALCQLNQARKDFVNYCNLMGFEGSRYGKVAKLSQIRGRSVSAIARSYSISYCQVHAHIIIAYMLQAMYQPPRLARCCHHNIAFLSLVQHRSVALSPCQATYKDMGLLDMNDTVMRYLSNDSLPEEV